MESDKKFSLFTAALVFSPRSFGISC